MSAIFIRTNRFQFVDFGRGTWQWKSTFIFRSPKAKTSINTFFKPLSKEVWVVTGFLGVLSVVILKIIFIFEKKKADSKLESSWSLLIMSTIGVFCQQGSFTSPISLCGRITSICVLLLSILIYQFYSASIVSNLLRKPTDTIKTLEDLAKSDLKLSLEDIKYNHKAFLDTTDPFLTKIYKEQILGLNNKSNFFPLKKGIELIRKGGWAFHVETSRGYPIIEENFSDNIICELREVDLFPANTLHPTYAKESSFRDAMEVW